MASLEKEEDKEELRPDIQIEIPTEQVFSDASNISRNILVEEELKKINGDDESDESDDTEDEENSNNNSDIPTSADNSITPAAVTEEDEDIT